MALNWKQEERFYAQTEYGVYRINPAMKEYTVSLMIMDETGMPMPTLLGSQFKSLEEAKKACEQDYVDREQSK
jgi:hypothetical protein